MDIIGRLSFRKVSRFSFWGFFWIIGSRRRGFFLVGFLEKVLDGFWVAVGGRIRFKRGLFDIYLGFRLITWFDGVVCFWEFFRGFSRVAFSRYYWV